MQCFEVCCLNVLEMVLHVSVPTRPGWQLCRLHCIREQYSVTKLGWPCVSVRVNPAVRNLHNCVKGTGSFEVPCAGVGYVEHAECVAR